MPADPSTGRVFRHKGCSNADAGMPVNWLAIFLSGSRKGGMSSFRRKNSHAHPTRLREIIQARSNKSAKRDCPCQDLRPAGHSRQWKVNEETIRLGTGHHVWQCLVGRLRDGLEAATLAITNEPIRAVRRVISLGVIQHSLVVYAGIQQLSFGVNDENKRFSTPPFSRERPVATFLRPRSPS